MGVRPGEPIRDADEALIIAKWRATPKFGRVVLEKRDGRLASGELVERFKGPVHWETEDPS